jgi:hypothetical protein
LQELQTSKFEIKPERHSKSLPELYEQEEESLSLQDSLDNDNKNEAGLKLETN